MKEEAKDRRRLASQQVKDRGSDLSTKMTRTASRQGIKKPAIAKQPSQTLYADIITDLAEKPSTTQFRTAKANSNRMPVKVPVRARKQIKAPTKQATTSKWIGQLRIQQLITLVHRFDQF